jgi:hypothetical protein
MEEQRLGGDAADVEAGASELVGALDECGFQAEFSGADGCGVTGRAAADDCYVVNCLCQGDLLSGRSA